MFNGLWSEFLASNRGEAFDLVFTSHVLEHIVNPMNFIKECAAVCNRYMFIEVPCFDINLMEEPYGMFTDEHVNIFTIQSLWNLMSRAGFAPVEFEMPICLNCSIPSAYPAISTLWKKSSESRPIYNSGDCLERYLSASEVLWHKISAKLDEIPDDEKLAVWGIGNSFSKIAGNTKLATKKVVRAYDSDKRKQGIKVLGTPITPFNADDILSGEVDAILITTCMAQRTITKILNQMNLPCKVYKLYDL